ncbi:MAG: L,D-transpeptidase, partial [Verrucomicrobiota bacterium]
MRKFSLFFTIIALLLSIANGSCQLKNRQARKSADGQLHGAINLKSNIPFDSSLVTVFYQSYPLLSKYKKDVFTVYREHHFHHIWFDEKGVVEFGQTLYNKANDLKDDGVSSRFPYQEKVDGVFDNEIENTLSKTETELMLTNLYLFYTEKVYKGIDEDSTTAIGWLLPRKKVSYTSLLDSTMLNPDLLNKDEKVLFSQYYKLREVLKRYRDIEKNGGWNMIDQDPELKAYKPGDTAKAIRQIRERLFVTGDLKQNSGSNQYDPELVVAVEKYQNRNGYNPGKLISREHIREMNVPIGDRIRKIIVNMERCRWISPEFAKAKAYIV